MSLDFFINKLATFLLLLFYFFMGVDKFCLLFSCLIQRNQLQCYTTTLLTLLLLEIDSWHLIFGSLRPENKESFKHGMAQGSQSSLWD